MIKNKKFLKVFLILFILIIFFVLHKSSFLNSYLNFDHIKTNQEKFQNYLHQSPIFSKKFVNFIRRKNV